MRSYRTLSISAVLLPVLAIGGALPASAHAHLIRALPAANAVLHVPPPELRLEFSEGLEVKFTTVKVTGPGQSAVATGKPTLDPGDGKVLIVPVSGSLSAGRYTVDWNAVSTDTHRTQGSYNFTLKP